MKVSFDPGTEKWIPWGHARLAEMRKFRARSGAPSFTRAWEPESGVQVWARSASSGDWLRITGGAIAFTSAYAGGPAPMFAKLSGGLRPTGPQRFRFGVTIPQPFLPGAPHDWVFAYRQAGLANSEATGLVYADDPLATTTTVSIPEHSSLSGFFTLRHTASAQLEVQLGWNGTPDRLKVHVVRATYTLDEDAWTQESSSDAAPFLSAASTGLSVPYTGGAQPPSGFADYEYDMPSPFPVGAPITLYTRSIPRQWAQQGAVYALEVGRSVLRYITAATPGVVAVDYRDGPDDPRVVGYKCWVTFEGEDRIFLSRRAEGSLAYEVFHDRTRAWKCRARLSCNADGTGMTLGAFVPDEGEVSPPLATSLSGIPFYDATEISPYIDAEGNWAVVYVDRAYYAAVEDPNDSTFEGADGNTYFLPGWDTATLPAMTVRALVNGNEVWSAAAGLNATARAQPTIHGNLASMVHGRFAFEYSVDSSTSVHWALWDGSSISTGPLGAASWGGSVSIFAADGEAYAHGIAADYLNVFARGDLVATIELEPDERIFHGFNDSAPDTAPLRLYSLRGTPPIGQTRVYTLLQDPDTGEWSVDYIEPELPDTWTYAGTERTKSQGNSIQYYEAVRDLDILA